MDHEEPIGCARVTSKVVGAPPYEVSAPQPTVEDEVPPMTARVGQQAPDFTAPAYHQGTFTNVTLSDFAGKWVLLCFYPGDFTFV